MAIFKCKMCGGSLDINEEITVCECEYCGTRQTFPKTRDDALTNLFNRANSLRARCDFEKSHEIYEKIISENPEEAEAYWGMILCRYGIEYVEDPQTKNKVPTCHITQYESIQTDDDYKNAIKYSDDKQKAVYEKEAVIIDKLQKDILAIVNKEEPFDVFICYKESDENGNRTTDSVIANDIYHQLTNEGYKVFYAAITLEDKLGQAYEPYIFAALNSSKVMLAIGSKPEYFNAVWVKNEWSRYLKLMKKDPKRLLIPCYKDMDPYNLPTEFSHLQAQDMNKIGFISDIIRGIKKVIYTENSTPANTNAVATDTTLEQKLDNFLKRGMISVENCDWTEARRNFDKVLDINPEEARAYVGLLMTEYQLPKESDFANLNLPFDVSNNYKNILRFGSPTVKENFIQYNNQAAYNHAFGQLQTAISSNSVQQYEIARQLFTNIKDFKDSQAQIELCNKNITDIVETEKAMIARAKREQEEQIRMEKRGKIIIAAIPATLIFLMIFSKMLQKIVWPLWILCVVLFVIGVVKKSKLIPEAIHKADLSIKIVASVLFSGLTGGLAFLLYSLFDKFI